MERKREVKRRPVTTDFLTGSQRVDAEALVKMATAKRSIATSKRLERRDACSCGDSSCGDTAILAAMLAKRLQNLGPKAHGRRCEAAFSDSAESCSCGLTSLIEQAGYCA
jgi:hypothetical protein